MRQLIYVILAAIPFSLHAQAPVIYQGDNYVPGMVENYETWNYMSPGPAGANQVWDFTTGVLKTGNLTYTYSAPKGSPEIPSSNLIAHCSDSNNYYFNTSSSGSIMTGIVDSSPSASSQLTFYHPGLLQSVRPMSYGYSSSNSYIDNYSVYGQPAAGSGTSSISIDGYGTIVLPDKSHPYVLRVKLMQNEMDSVTGTGPYKGSASITTTSYLWYDTLHIAPIFRVDSIYIQYTAAPIVSLKRALYLTSETMGVPNVTDVTYNFTGYFSNNALVVNGDWIGGKPYEVTVFNMLGQKLLNRKFVSNGASVRFEGNWNQPGIYILEVKQAGITSVCKIAKQY